MENLEKWPVTERCAERAEIFRAASGIFILETHTHFAAEKRGRDGDTKEIYRGLFQSLQRKRLQLCCAGIAIKIVRLD